MQPTVLRVARPTNDISRVVGFYTQGLGFKVLASFVDHEGFDGVIVGRPDCHWHIEFTHRHAVTVAGAPSAEHLLVLYVPDQQEWSATVARIHALGIAPSKSENPYWDRQGLTFEDPDGYRVVLQNAAWG